ncbi:hypothetical protein RE628_16960 [Paenibacillus sp. D2_2]|uniref:hypothetical protein n=1 Tax=Paenibacillus sp. D2_2 TaxID=3073092 RepID=UPI00281658A1|nr:hypothetical protein [Paenibacillus sp. D2_2]WMT39170.1 hypothetical protein RE628_16960 [Paenibacillus sp. D2_2]
MTGKIRYFMLFGFIGFLITFAASAGNNLFATSLIRSIVAFAIWFALSWVGSWMISFLKELPPDVGTQEEAALAAEIGKGGNLDLTTPDESKEIGDLLKQAPEGELSEQQFTPLNPPRLVKTTDDKDPEELAKVVRHLTEQ